MPAFSVPIAGALFGLIIGSFLATLILRWPEGRSVIAGRSSCDQCGHQLRSWELIPVVSFLLQTGKCRKCGARIAKDHFAIELAAALIGGLALYVAPDLEGLAGAIFGWLLLTLAALDVKHHWLPDRLTALLAVCGVAASLLVAYPALQDRLIGGLAGFVSLAIIAAIYKSIRKRDGLGGGDPKMLGAIGCWLGWQALPLVILGASLIGILVAISWRLRGENVDAGTMLPLGSLMAMAAFPLWLFQTAGTGSLY
ncbi:prepilin peptidase [Sphingorhabdus sp. M41]|uniref:prepilin peptidase n=1 Tax=Sphingorhabdus sp. M41 TaxID=1806885 RepID=UPI00078C678C|nr:A24 family peptidase [Sphingorhabdus sp. M41]AMO71896.1 peptidase A24 [Sphingorhabdus sp. M41]